MRASESLFQSYKSKRILSFTNLFLTVSGPKALKKDVCVLPYSFTVEKLWNVYETVLEKCEVFVQKSLSLKNILPKENRRKVFVVYMLIYSLSKFGSNRTNSLCGLALYSVRFK